MKQLLAQAEAADEAEDRQYGDQRGDELPEELRRRETRLARIKEAKKVLEQRARDKAAAEGKSAAEAKPEDKDQYNFTDPESRIMKGADGIVQGYNAQAAVEPTLLLIVGQSVTEAANDKQQLMPMVELIEQQSGQRPEAILADNGYCSEENLEHLESAEATGASDRGVHRDGQAKAWRASIAGQARSVAEGRDQGGADETEAADQGGQSRLRGAQMRGGTGVRADQAGAWIPSILATRKRESERGVGAAVPDA